MGKRLDREPGIRMSWERNKKRVLASQDYCGICGQLVDKSLRFPDPMSATVDHIIPVAKGGHPTNLNNLQLAHLYCNRVKSDKLMMRERESRAEADNQNLPWSIDWKSYRSEEVKRKTGGR